MLVPTCSFGNHLTLTRLELSIKTVVGWEAAFTIVAVRSHASFYLAASDVRREIHSHRRMYESNSLNSAGSRHISCWPKMDSVRRCRCADGGCPCDCSDGWRGSGRTAAEDGS